MATHPLTKFATKDMPGYYKPLSYLRWNNNGSYLAAVGNDKTIRISQFDTSNGSLMSVNLISSSVKISQICWNPQESGRIALCSDEKAIELWDCRGLQI
jgi:WD40 repeat protein